MGRCSLMVAVLAAVVGTAAGAGVPVNLLPNGDFARGLDGWRTLFPEANETKYARNHECVAVADAPGGGAGRALRFTLTRAVAESQGVKAVTALLPVEPQGRYEFGAELLTRGPSAILFVEGYRADPAQKASGNDQYPGYVRCYRATLFPQGAGGAWTAQARTIDLGKLRENQRPTHLLVKLYAFHPAGEVFFRNVFLRKAEKRSG